MMVVHPIGAFVAILALGLVAGVYLGLILAPWFRRKIWEAPGFVSQRENSMEQRLRAWKTMWAWETGRLKDLARAKRAAMILKAEHDDPGNVWSADLVP